MFQASNALIEHSHIRMVSDDGNDFIEFRWREANHQCKYNHIAVRLRKASAFDIEHFVWHNREVHEQFMTKAFKFAEQLFDIEGGLMEVAEPSLPVAIHRTAVATIEVSLSECVDDPSWSIQMTLVVQGRDSLA